MSYDGYTAKKIRVYRNNDRHFPGKKMVVNERVLRNFEKFLLVVTEAVHLRTGAVRKLVEMETGIPIKSFSDLKDGMYYVATSGEPYKKIDYIVKNELGQPIGMNDLNLHRDIAQKRRKINRSTGGLLFEPFVEPASEREAPLFKNTSKGYKIVFFENGEAVDCGTKIILNHRNCQNFEQFLRTLSAALVIKTGQVRKVYDAETGTRIHHLSELKDGQNIVGSTYEPFKQMDYPLENVYAPRKRSEPEKQKIVTFYPNGDSYSSGLTMTISKKRFSTFQKLLAAINNQMVLITGKGQKIYTISGIRIFSLDDMENSKSYVVVANDDPFIKTQYNVMASRKNELDQVIHDAEVVLTPPPQHKSVRKSVHRKSVYYEEPAELDDEEPGHFHPEMSPTHSRKSTAKKAPAKTAKILSKKASNPAIVDEEPGMKTGDEIYGGGKTNTLRGKTPQANSKNASNKASRNIKSPPTSDSRASTASKGSNKNLKATTPKANSKAPSDKDLKSPKSVSKAPSAKDLKSPKSVSKAPSEKEIKSPKSVSRAPSEKEIKSPKSVSKAPSEKDLKSTKPSRAASPKEVKSPKAVSRAPSAKTRETSVAPSERSRQSSQVSMPHSRASSQGSQVQSVKSKPTTAKSSKEKSTKSIPRLPAEV